MWSNDGSVPAEPTYTFGPGPYGANWLVRVFALDQSTALNGVTDGLLMIPSAATTPENQANFYNVDEQVFTVRGAVVDVAKSLQTIADPISITSRTWSRAADGLADTAANGSCGMRVTESTTATG